MMNDYSIRKLFAKYSHGNKSEAKTYFNNQSENVPDYMTIDDLTSLCEESQLQMSQH